MTDRPAPSPPLLGAVLVGGASRRMGRDKATLPIDGARTMLDGVLAALDPLCAEVVLLGAWPGPAPAPRRVILDDTPNVGPLEGIRRALRDAADHNGAARDVLVTPCDLPRLTTDVLRPLAELPAGTHGALHVRGEPTPRPLPARLAPSALDVIDRALADGTRAVWRVMERLVVTAIPVNDDRALRNVNTPADLAALRKGQDA